MDGLAESLRLVGILRDVEEAALAALAAQAEVKKLPRGTVAMHQGSEDPACLFLLVSGSVDVVKRGVDQRSRVIAQLTGPTVFGEIELLAQSGPVASVVAASDLCVAVISRAALDDWFTAWPAAAVALLRNLAGMLARRLAATDEQLSACLGLPGVKAAGMTTLQSALYGAFSF